MIKIPHIPIQFAHYIWSGGSGCCGNSDKLEEEKISILLCHQAGRILNEVKTHGPFKYLEKIRLETVFEKRKIGELRIDFTHHHKDFGDDYRSKLGQNCIAGLFCISSDICGVNENRAKSLVRRL